jgi:hypothetical protein
MDAEGASAAMLGMRLGLNAINRWECRYLENGTLNMDDCPGMENATEWFMKNGKNINKDILKRMIQVGMALQAAVNGTDFDPNKPMRMLQDASNDTTNMDFGDLNETAALWMKVMMMKTEKEQIAYLNANRQMVGEVPFKKIRTVVRKMLKPEIKKALMTYHAQKLAAFKAQRACFVRLMKIQATM